MCVFVFWFTATGVLPQLAISPEGNQLDVSSSPMHKKLFPNFENFGGGLFPNRLIVRGVSKNKK
jgi:hypothetical protein